MSTRANRYRTYTFSLEVELMKEFKEQKEKYGINMSGLINSLLKAYLAKKRLQRHNVNTDKIINNVIAKEIDTMGDIQIPAEN